MCLALMFKCPKLSHYMQAYTVYVISKADPIKYIPSRLVLNGQLVKWAFILKQYGLVHVSQKAING